MNTPSTANSATDTATISNENVELNQAPSPHGTEPTTAITTKNQPSTKQEDPHEKQKKRGLWSKLGVAVLLALAVALYLLRNILLGTPITVYAATSGELAQSVVASGRVISPQRVTVALQGSGRVLRVAVTEGQNVEAGQLLIELDNSDSRASLAQASGVVLQAQAKLRQLSELNQPQAMQALAQAQATLLQARKTLTRNRELVAQGFVSQAAVDDAQRAVDVAASQVVSSQAQVKTNTADGSDRLLAEAALRQAQAGQQLARAKLDQGLVYASSSGVLISRSVEVGDIVQPGKALMVLAASGQSQILIQIDEKNLSKIALGQKAYASADAFASQRFDAVVAYINPGVDAARGSVEVKLSIANPPAYLRQDMTVSVDIETARRTATVVIPTSALQDTATDKPWVLVVRDKRAVKQFVTLGLLGDTRVEVLQGLAKDEGVIPKSKLGIKDGQRVRARVEAVPPPTTPRAAGKRPIDP